MKGKAHVYGRKHINTDEIIPARYLNSDVEAELAKHAMEDLDRSFVGRVGEGDILVAGNDFGCGSSREHAVWALRGAGISMVLADGFARLFFRNCLNNGLPAIECPGISSKVKDGDVLEVDLDEGVIMNRTRKEEYTFMPMLGFSRQLLDAGGLINHITGKGGANEA